MPSSAAGIELTGIEKRFGAVAALAGVSWIIEPGACVGLVGSSGSGKTTLLRILAGLEQPDVGAIRFNNSRPTIGMVFQNLGLWPHLTARQHVSCVLDAAKSKSFATVDSLLDEVRLPRSAWDRRPNELSGGEGQRVALARALACNPQLLLLDEPLAHLDAVLRTELLDQVADLVRRRAMTVVYVTHAWSEAAVLCQRIGVLESGRLEQTGTPCELFWHPANQTVARLTGPVLTLPRAWLAEGRIAADPQSPAWRGLPIGSDEELWLRPQQLRMQAAEGANTWRVVECRPSHASWQINLTDDAGNHLAIPSAVVMARGETMGLLLNASLDASSGSW
jgi:ABC-type Fe3+/spermidine/putrescine transport system ATPase subunit